MKYGDITEAQRAAALSAMAEAFFPFAQWARIQAAQGALDPLEEESIRAGKTLLEEVEAQFREQASLARRDGEERWEGICREMADELHEEAVKLEGASELALAGVNGSMLGISVRRMIDIYNLELAG